MCVLGGGDMDGMQGAVLIPHVPYVACGESNGLDHLCRC